MADLQMIVVGKPHPFRPDQDDTRRCKCGEVEDVWLHRVGVLERTGR